MPEKALATSRAASKRLQTLQRNHASRKDVALSVIRYHVVSIAIGLLLNYGNEPELTGSQECEIFQWAAWIRKLPQFQPLGLGLSLLGVDAKRLALAVYQSPLRLERSLDQRSPELPSVARLTPSAFNSIDMVLAKIIYSVLMPAIQFGVALAVVDT